MANAAAFQRIKRDTLAIVGKVPVGFVTTHGDVGRQIDVLPRHIATILATLDDIERETVSWWRVVADGGAVGRHNRRDDQITRLQADGIVLSPVGIVQDLADRRDKDFAAPPSGIVKPPDPAPGVKPSRSRGMLGKPSSSL